MVNELPTAKTVLQNWLKENQQVEDAGRGRLESLKAHIDKALVLWKDFSKAFSVPQKKFDEIKEVEDLRDLRNMALNLDLILTNRYAPPRFRAEDTADD